MTDTIPVKRDTLEVIVEFAVNECSGGIFCYGCRVHVDDAFSQQDCEEILREHIGLTKGATDNDRP